MPTITSGSNVTGTFGTTDSLTISTRGNARLEVPTGTTVAEFSGTRTLGPYTGQSYRITAVAGDVNYDFLDGSGPVASVTADTSTGTLYANGSPVSGGGKSEADVVGDSIPLQGFGTPSSSFGATTARGSYVDGATVKQVGVQTVFAENPVRMAFRAAHGLASGARGYFDGAPSNYPLAGTRHACQVLDATTITLPGVDGTLLPVAHASAAVANDILFQVDSSYGNAGWLCWMLFRLRNPFRSVGKVCRNGGTTAQVLAAYKANRPTTRKRVGYAHLGRNDGNTFDQASSDELAALMLQDYDYVRWVIPFQDAGANATAGFLTRIKGCAAWVRAKEVVEPRFRGLDLFGAFSDSTAAFEASLSSLLSSDLTHLRMNGGRVAGYTIVDLQLDGPLNPVSESVALASSASNLLTGARFTGKAGTLGGISEGDVATGWTIAGTNHVAGGVVGIYSQVLATPPIPWQPGLAVTKGQIIRVPGDPNWYAVKAIASDGKLLTIRPKATYDAAPLNDNSAVTPVAGLTLSLNTAGAGRTVTADAAIFSAADVGKRIRNLDLTLDGHATITGFTNTTTVTATVDTVFAGGTALASGAWMLETTLANGGVGFADGNATLYKIEPFTDSTLNLLWQWTDVQISQDDSNRRVEFWQNIALPGTVTAGVSQVQGQIDAVLLSRYRWWTARIKCLNGSTQVGASHGMAVNGTASYTPYMGLESGVLPLPPTDVPVGTTNLEFGFHFAPGIEGGRFAVCLPVMELAS
jgi:hypothetical protein